jgi:hypothetical protein
METLIRTVFVAAAWFLLSLVLVWLPAWWLWNNVLVTTFGLPQLTFLQCVGLLAFVWLARNGMTKISVQVGDSD